MDRYEIVLYVSTRGTRFALFLFQVLKTWKMNCLLRNSGINATGKRLTSKNGKVKAKPWFARVRVPEDAQYSTYKFVKAQVGYAIKGRKP